MAGDCSSPSTGIGKTISVLFPAGKAWVKENSNASLPDGPHGRASHRRETLADLRQGG